jgi:hypothetical protein
VCFRGYYIWLGQDDSRVYGQSFTTPADVEQDGTQVHIRLRVVTPDIGPAGPFGTVKIARTVLLARKVDSHGWLIATAPNQGDTFTTRTWTSAEVDAFVGLPQELVTLMPASSKEIEGSTIRYQISDTAPDAPADPTAGPALLALQIEYSVEPGAVRVPAAQSK